MTPQQIHKENGIREDNRQVLLLLVPMSWILSVANGKPAKTWGFLPFPSSCSPTCSTKAFPVHACACVCVMECYGMWSEHYRPRRQSLKIVSWGPGHRGAPGNAFHLLQPLDPSLFVFQVSVGLAIVVIIAVIISKKGHFHLAFMRCCSNHQLYPGEQSSSAHVSTPRPFSAAECLFSCPVGSLCIHGRGLT